jgi:hypothetical protein
MKSFRSILLTLASAALMTACGSKTSPTPTATITPSSTPDPCAPENISVEVAQVHALTRAFDDSEAIAENTARSQLGPAIAELQRIRRIAEAQRVPACLVNLKKLQLLYMNTVINTLLDLMGGINQQTLNQGIALFRQQHDQYMLEAARLLGLTVVAPPTGTAAAQPPAPGVTQTAPAPTFAVTNPGPNPVNLRASPALNGLQVGVLDVGQSAIALGKSPDGQWVWIQRPDQPGQTAWVYAPLVKFSSDPASLPIVTPTP